MLYRVTLRSQVAAGVPSSQKHKTLVKEWTAIDGSWKLSGEPACPGTEFDCLSATCKLTRLLPARVKGEVTYHYRPEDGSETDWLDSIHLEFNPHRVPYRELLETALPILLRAFEASHAYIYDDELNQRRREAEGDEKGYIPISVKHLWRAQPIWFADEEYCSGCYRLSCNEVADRLRDLAAHVEIIAGGVYVVGSYAILSTDAFDEMGNRFEAALRPVRKAWWKFW